MTSPRTDLGDLLAFNDWAMGRMLDAVAGLSPDEWTREVGGSFGTIQATVAHMVGAEWLWLQRWKGTSPDAAPAELRSAEPGALARLWEALAAERMAWWAALPEARMGEPLSYRRIDGTASTNRLDVLVRHVVNHASYHRGQVAAFLRNIGRTPPATDLVLWDRERSG